METNMQIRRGVDTDLTRPLGEQHRSRIEFFDQEALGPWESEVDAIERLETCSRRLKKEIEAEHPGTNVDLKPVALGAPPLPSGGGEKEIDHAD